MKNKNSRKKSSKISNNKNKLNLSDDFENRIENTNYERVSNSDKIVKIHKQFQSPNFVNTKILRILLISILAIFLSLIIRIGFIQFAEGAELKELAYNQQNINQIISPKRGNIYDSTGKALAISASVDTITINPTKIKDSSDDEKTKELKEKVAKGLSEIFSLDYNEVLEKVNSNSSVETIVKKVEQEKVEELKNWMEENKISVGINIDEDTKRYYPYSNLLSHVLGFCGNDNQGLWGLEYEWDSVLTGTPGKIVSSKDGSQQEIPNTEETYIPAEDGSNITLTIDYNIQTIVEKYLKQAVDDNNCTKGGNVIVMNPENGDILAMASYPDYDLNNPYTPNSTLQKTYNSLSDEEETNAIYSMWRNKSVSELYEPGSTFKIITSAIALQENITGTDIENDFYCNGYEQVEDRKIDCWRAEPHRSQTLRNALCNSCNPAFMQLGARIGSTTLYKYYEAFGLFDKTGVGLYGEENSIFQPLEKVGAVERATMSFGQRLNITPLQMITAVSCVANDGILMKPRIVKEITNTDTGAVTEIAPTEVRQVLSKETADKVKSLMESVVTVGTGKHGAVTGYSVGGKTGTSEPLEKNKEEGYVASFVGISPVEDTKVCILLTLYDPKGDSYQGGQVAAPVVSQMLSEILPYLGIPSNSTEQESSSSSLITVPDVRNKTVTEAQKVLTSAGFTCKIISSGDNNSTIVSDQVPKPGTMLKKDSIICLYSDNTVRTSVTVPDLKGMTLAQATNSLKSKNLNISSEGSGVVVTQDYAKNTSVEEGTVIKVTLKQTLTEGH